MKPVAVILFALLAVPLVVGAQQAKEVPRVGFLSADTAADSTVTIGAFRQGLREVGRIEGQSVAIEWRFAEGRWDRVTALAAELARLPVDVAVTNQILTVRSLRVASPTVPIVLAGADHLWSQVGSIARPGGNTTGMSSIASELESKRVELLRAAVPAVSRVAVLRDMTT